MVWTCAAEPVFRRDHAGWIVIHRAQGAVFPHPIQILGQKKASVQKMGSGPRQNFACRGLIYLIY